jgi:hypothetical protein
MRVDVSEAYGRHLTLRELAFITSQGIATLFDWRTDAELRQVETLLILLERLTPSKRLEVVNQICRTLPSIHDEKLAWAETQVAHLEALLRTPQGLTIIQGDDSAASYMATALGHSSWRMPREGLPVCGVDCRVPERFVPVDGVAYCDPPLRPGDAGYLFAQTWPSVRSASGHLVLLVGCVPSSQDFLPEVSALAECSHVVVAGGPEQIRQRLKSDLHSSYRVVNASWRGQGQIEINVEQY